MADLKAALKEAKNAIKDKDYEAAMIHCKDALKFDRKNYQALAMFGRVCIEERRFTDSKRALLLASQVDPENPVAWHGLSNLHDKCSDVFDKEEEINILNQTIKITKEEEKLDHLYRKLATVHQRYGDTKSAVLVLEELLSLSKSDEGRKSIRESIIKLLGEDGSTDCLKKLVGHLEKNLTSTELSENELNHQKYLKFLYKAKEPEKLVSAARNMSVIFPTAYPLEWIARIYVEYSNHSQYRHITESISNEEISTVVSRLLSLFPGSPWGLMCRGMMYFKEKDYEKSKTSMRKGCEILGPNLTVWYLYLTHLLERGDSTGIEYVCSRLSSFIKDNSSLVCPSDFEDLESFGRYVLKTRIKALYNLGRQRHFQEIIDVLGRTEVEDSDMQVILIKSQVSLGLLEEASLALASLKDQNQDSVVVQRVTALLASARGDHSIAKSIYESLLSNEPNNPEILFELGKILYEMNDFQSSLLFLLKAAKFDPRMSSAYLLIGHYYRQGGNVEKARKCYEKALNLNSSNDEAALALSDAYRITGQNESNFALLLRVTGEGKSDWAWLRLGLQYMAVKRYDEAIKALQRAVNMNPRDRIAYECLGDAYLARGSHTAALKVFTKAEELEPQDALYSRCRIAHINHLVGDFLLSISQYDLVLKESLPESVRTVAYVGLAEVLLTRARKSGQEKLLSNLKEDCLYAIDCLSRAAKMNPGAVTIWKLLGDACTLQATLPPSLSNFSVCKQLLDPTTSNQEAKEEIDLKELLHLGAKCYGVGLKINENNSSLWHDLGVNLFTQGYIHLEVNKRSKNSPEDQKEWTTEEMREDFGKRAESALTKSINLDPSSFNTWNSLGVVAYYRGDLALAQHSFIRSLHLHPTAEGWTHLGVLYLHQDEIQLAHEAFSHGQAVDPSFVSNWVGQAMVATSVGHHEAFDLYRHTTQLGINPESCIGFAHNILKVACDKGKETEWKKLVKFLPTIHSCLSFYAREKEEDIIGQLMFGVTSEMVSLRHNAFEIFSKTLQLCNTQGYSQDIKDIILSNFGVTSTRLGRLEDAISCFSMIKEPTFYSQCGLALAKLKAGQYDEACKTYTEACEWFSRDKTEESHIYTALAFLFYMFGKTDETKDYLFKSCSTGSTFECRAALMALGLVQEDNVLTDAALNEISPSEDDPGFVHHVAFLKAALATLQNNPREAKLILSRAIHRHPHNCQLWRSLSHLLLTCMGTSSTRDVKGAIAASSAASVLAQASGDSDKVLQDVVSKAMSYLKLSRESLPDPPSASGKGKKKGQKKNVKTEVVSEEIRKRKSLVEAQKAVLMCPGRPEAWAVLASAMESKSKKCRMAQKWAAESQGALQIWFQSMCA